MLQKIKQLNTYKLLHNICFVYTIKHILCNQYVCFMISHDHLLSRIVINLILKIFQPNLVLQIKNYQIDYII